MLAGKQTISSPTKGTSTHLSRLNVPLLKLKFNSYWMCQVFAQWLTNMYVGIALFSASPHYGGREPCTFCHVHYVKSRHCLITQVWAKMSTNACSSPSTFKTTTVFFSSNYGFSLLSPSGQPYIDAHVELVNFLSQCWQLDRSIRMMLAYNTKFPAILVISCLSGDVSDTLKI